MNPLKHVAIIMDGNGRWGLKYKNSRNEGHREGINTLEKIIKEAVRNNIKYLTLYAFSTENWKRPRNEISFLFKLLENFLQNKINDLHRENIKLKIIGTKNFSKKINKTNRLSKNIIIAGGLTNNIDLEKLKKLKNKNIEGIISGKSFYEGKIDLIEAQKILN